MPHLWLKPPHPSPPRRVLLLITDLEIGGTPTVVRELAIRLNRGGGVVVEVACLKSPGPVAIQLRDAGVHVHGFDAGSVRAVFDVARDLSRLVRDRRYDAVFSFLVHANAVAALASRELPGVRLLQSIQTVQPRPGWHWWVQRWAARHADRVVVPSTAIVDFAARRSAIPREKFDVIPNAVDPADFPRATVFAGPRVRAGFLGRLDRVKRLEVALRAVHTVRKEFPVEMIIVGTGDSRFYRYWQGNHLGDPYGEIFKWPGPVARPQDALSRMDVLLLPSLAEGFGLVLIEAMASGVPVIASAAGGILDVVTHERDGLLVPPATDDHAGFAAALRRLRADAELRDHLIANGLRTVRERFAWDAVLPGYQRLLDL